jgi:DNA-binding PadR family transcriptional regulator
MMPKARSLDLSDLHEKDKCLVIMIKEAGGKMRATEIAKKGKDKCKISKATIYRHLGDLVRDGWLKKESKGRMVFYELTEEAWKALGEPRIDQEKKKKLEEFLEKWDGDPCTKGLPPPIDEAVEGIGLDPSDREDVSEVRELFSILERDYSKRVPREAKEKHMEELRKVVEAWLSEFPYINEVFELRFPMGYFKGTGREILAEMDPLFEDLKCHFEGILDRWEELKKLARGFWELRGKLREKIKEIALGEGNFKDFGICDSAARIWRDEPPNSIWEGLLDDILAEACGGHLPRLKSALEGKLDEERERKDGCKIIRSLGQYYAVIERGYTEERLEDWFKERLDRILKEVKSECSKDIEEFKCKKEELGELIENIENRLKEARYKTILSGYCKYLIAPKR